MQKNTRPQSAKCRRVLKTSHSSHSRQLPTPALNHQSHESMQIVRSLQSKTPVFQNQITRPVTANQDYARPSSSSSRFLHKYDQIKLYRQTVPLAENQITPTPTIFIQQKHNQMVDFKIHVKTPKNRPTTPITWQFPESQGLVVLQKRGRVLVNPSHRPISAKKYFQTLDICDFILRKEKPNEKNFKKYDSDQSVSQNNKQIDIKKQPKDQAKRLQLQIQKRITKAAYFKTQNKFVTLFSLDKNQEIRIQHQNLLPIYAQVLLEGERFVVSDQYENYSLRNMFTEFGALGERLAKRYLRQLALGLHHLHSQKRSHNCLTPDAVLYNKSGSLFINLLQAVAFPNKDELKHKELHYFSPDFLLQRKRFEPKNDVWGLGCLAIQMITGTEVIHSPLHPYNSNHHNISEQTMLQNVKERYEKYFQKQSQLQNLPKMSVNAKCFIGECLKILKEQRPSILNLLQHQFFEN